MIIHAGSRIAWRSLSALALVCLMDGCYLQSPYVTRERVSSGTVPSGTAFSGTASSRPASSGTSCELGDCNAGGDVGSTNARCTEREFENAISEHAELATGMGEALIPLAGLVAYRGIYSANQHNVAALATGGAAAYALGSYLYKPNDEIYLSGVSAIECAQRMTDARRISKADAAYLRGLLGTSSPEELAAAQLGIHDGNDLSKLDTTSSHEALIAAKNDLRDSSCKSLRKEAEEIVLNLESGLASTDELIRGIRERFEHSQSVALRMLRENQSVERDLCRATDQIRTDVNHMLTRQQADPLTLAGTLSSLKYPTAPTGSSGTGGSPSKNGTSSKVAALPTFRAAAIGAKCNLANSVTDLATRQHEAETDAKKAEQTVERINQMLTEIAPPDVKLDELLKKCGVAAVEKPVPLSLSVSGTLEIAQGASYQVAITGGHSPFRLILVNSPKDGSIKLTSNGSDAVGNSFTIAVAAGTTEGSYGVVLVDAEGATQSFTVKVKKS